MCPLRYLIALISLLLLTWAAVSLLWLPDDTASLASSGAGRVWRSERTWVRSEVVCVHSGWCQRNSQL